tara:strand:- start:9519 stop:10190 length:672 start_codon:yes stop_codon:yes gene_type:complete
MANDEFYNEVDLYLEARLLPKDPVLDDVIGAQDAAGLPPMAVSPLQGAFLKMLAQSIGARRILELGTFAGYSTVWLARALPDGGKVITLEHQNVNADLSEKNFARAGVSHLIEIRRGKAFKSMNIMINDGVEPFDLIFMDADKINYPVYIHQVLLLSRPGTVIVADNVVREGRILDDSGKDPSVRGVRTFLEKLTSHPQVESTALQTVGSKGHDGFAMMRVKS